jgi:hypothetical protein
MLAVGRLAMQVTEIESEYRVLVQQLREALQRGLERARALLREMLPEPIRMEADERKGCFTAHIPRFVGGGRKRQTDVVAGAGFEPATFGL